MLSGPRFSNTLFGIMTSMGFIGTKLMEFTNAVGIGSDSHVSGKSFVTIDTGSVPGNGVGVGTGLTGIISTTTATDIFALASSFGFIGTKLFDTCTAMGEAIVTEMGNASLNSIDTPVFVGIGIITPGSFTVDPTSWSSSVQSEGSSEGFIGSKWPEFATAIGTGYYQGFQTATGELTITGSPTGIPAPGTGAGVGIIT
jgi:hypothetical protein